MPTTTKSPPDRESPETVLSPSTTDFLAHEKLLPASEFARLIGVSLTTERSMRARRQAPSFVRRGTAVFYTYEAVADWLRSREIKSGSFKRHEEAVADSLLSRKTRRRLTD